MERITKPFFHFDPGWLFILSGLALCAAGILLPAQADVEALQRQLEQLRDEESRALARLKAHADFLDQVDRADPALIKRLAAAQLNLVPEGDRPVLRATSNTVPVTNWVDSTVSFDIRPPKPQPVSTLSRWATGPQRLWMFGGGILAVFIGVLLSPAPVRIGRWRRTAATQQNTTDQLADGAARHPGFATSTDDDELLEDQDAAACGDCDDDEDDANADDASAAIADDDAFESDSLSDAAPDEEDEAEGEDEEEYEEQADDELIDDDSEELLDEAADDFEEEEVEDEEEYEYEEEDDDAFDDDDSEASAYSDDVLTEDEEDEEVEDEFDELSDDDEASDEDEDNLEDEDESEYFDEDDDDSFIAETDDDEDVDGYDDGDGDDEADMDEDDDQPPFSPTSRW